MMTWIFDLLATALFVVFFQNLIFCGGFGMSEVVSVAAKPKQIISFAVLVSVFSSFTAVSCRLLDLVPRIAAFGELEHIVIYVGCLLVIYLLISTVLILFFRASSRSMKRVGLAAFNTLVLAIPILNNKAAYTISESIGMGIGAGIAFGIAVLLIHIGMINMENNTNNGDTPKAFRGTPIVFIYMSILALAFTGISGSSLFV